MTTITKDMTKVADVIGELGLNIAEAQKEFDANYLSNRNSGAQSLVVHPS